MRSQVFTTILFLGSAMLSSALPQPAQSAEIATLSESTILGREPAKKPTTHTYHVNVSGADNSQLNKACTDLVTAAKSKGFTVKGPVTRPSTTEGNAKIGHKLIDITGSSNPADFISKLSFRGIGIDVKA